MIVIEWLPPKVRLNFSDFFFFRMKMVKCGHLNKCKYSLLAIVLGLRFSSFCLAFYGIRTWTQNKLMNMWLCESERGWMRVDWKRERGRRRGWVGKCVREIVSVSSWVKFSHQIVDPPKWGHLGDRDTWAWSQGCPLFAGFTVHVF